MTENEKFLEVGKLAEEYSKIKGQLTDVTNKLSQTHVAYQRIFQAFPQLSVHDRKLTIANPRSVGITGAVDFSDLLNEVQLAELLSERNKLTLELEAARGRLRGLAPHLL